MRRVKVLAFPKFQLRLMMFHFVVMSTFSLVLWAIIHYSFAALRDIGAQASLSRTHPFFELLGLQQVIVTKYFFAVFIIFFILSSVFYLVFSHRMVGPICRLKGYFQNYKEGQEIHFRKGDYLQELAPHINRTVNRGGRG